VRGSFRMTKWTTDLPYENRTASGRRWQNSRLGGSRCSFSQDTYLSSQLPPCETRRHKAEDTQPRWVQLCVVCSSREENLAFLHSAQIPKNRGAAANRPVGIVHQNCSPLWVANANQDSEGWVGAGHGVVGLGETERGVRHRDRH
jgi:hypothetical protein